MTTSLKRHEDTIIENFRDALVHLDTDTACVRRKMKRVHEIFADHLVEWSDEFCRLYHQMLEIYRAHTPQPTGRNHTRHVSIGYSSFPLQTFIADKKQPPPPSSEELVARFDQLLSESQFKGESTHPHE